MTDTARCGGCGCMVKYDRMHRFVRHDRTYNNGAVERCRGSYRPIPYVAQPMTAAEKRLSKEMFGQ